MNSDNIKDTMESMLVWLKGIGMAMSELHRQQRHIEGELNDINHELELATLNASEMAKLASEQRRLLRQRRKIKDELVSLAAFKEFQGKHSQLKYTIEGALKEHGTAKWMLDNRQYKPRVKQGLRCSAKDTGGIL